MVEYTFTPRTVIDAAGFPARGATGQVYAKSDTGFTTPLTATDPETGNAIQITTNELGIPPTFIVDHAEPRVVWKSGSLPAQEILSLDPMIDAGADASTARSIAEGVAPDNGVRAVGKGELVVNVKDYGAVGDGSTDDTATIQDAMDALGAAGGGVLFFPPGEFYMDDKVFLVSDVEIHGRGATIRKRSTSTSYVAFAGSSGSTTGYGAGPSNIHVHDITFRGEFGVSHRSACALALHHCDNVRVERVKFTEASGQGHRLDLQGCRFVSVRDCVFEGFDLQAGLSYNEDIQPDYSTLRGGSFDEADTSCYDGLPTYDVTVDGCVWNPLNVGGTDYPCAPPFGTHATVEGLCVSKLRFTNNVINDPVDAVDDDPGVLHFDGVKDVVIANNRIDGATTLTCPAIAFYASTGGAALVDVGNENAGVTYGSPLTCENIVVHSNTITGFHDALNEALIRLRGLSTAHFVNVHVTENHLFDTNDSAGVSNTGPFPVTMQYINKGSFRGNRVERSRRVAILWNSSDLTVTGNVGDTIAINDITVDTCDRVTVSGNTLTGVNGYGIYSVGCTVLSITGNTVSGPGAGGPMIRANSTGFAVAGNMCSGEAGAVKGIEVTGATSKGTISGNTVKGFTTPLTPATTSADVEVSGNKVIT